jgi:HK97 family phage portal protein
MHLLRPDLVKVLFENGDIAGYEYTPKNGSPVTYKPEEIIYSFNPDPQKPLEGESILRAGIRAIDTELQLSEYHSRVLRNGGRVDGVFNFKAALNKEQLQSLKDGYKEEYAGARQAGMPLFLGGDAKYERVALNPDELSYLESKNVTLDEICLMTGVPRAVLARASEETYANADAAISIFLRETIKPLLVNLTSLLDWRLVPDDLDLDFKDPTPEDIDRKVKVVTAAHAVSAATTNEKREMLGLDPLPDKEADEILVPFSLTPLGQKPEPHEKPGQEPPEEKRKAFEHPLRDEFVRKRYGAVMAKRLDRREAEFKQAIARYFEEQRTRLLDHIGETRVFRRKDLFDDALNRDTEIRLAKGTALPLLQMFLKDAGDDALALIGFDYDFNLSSDIASWLDGRADVFAKQITATTFENLKDQFAASFEAGESRRDLIKRIEDTYAGYTETRATTIARTEVHAAMQKGTFEGYRQARLPTKIWVTVGDAHVRDSHAAQDGEEVPIDAPFSNGLQYPGDPRADASEVINCRCSV